MKQRVWHSRPKRVRFVRWSRHAAAVFHSIKLEVNIGQLKASVQERIAPKAKSMVALLSIIQNEVNVNDKESQEYLDEGVLPEAYLLSVLTLGVPSGIEKGDASF